ncbi:MULTISPECIES: sensor histidine kinase [unclassified Thermoactinomyces]|uniref:sensor histidine kinase n=1 Tax=unclassified Thermoactinomyces TaxID=2634588 RepID=UPI0018DD748B|nr:MULTISPECIES: histidine kinase [unclassified Thermoactinomyces]MBH8598814.1 sensor histidine kinase [Thermoactinomyces sp. CICC 10523]MBH8604799.1 sensor histidine kinase [Thermoactinomyces sp. CICC 10522]
MSYKQIKWLILIIPTLVTGVWEYVRHQFLLPVISMQFGNYLTPVLVFAVTITLLYRLFAIYENMQEELKKEREEKAVFKERERIARELHDGIAQTLFLCSVKLNRLREKYPDADLVSVDQHLRQIHDDVRQAIFNVKTASSLPSQIWQKQLETWFHLFETDTGIAVRKKIDLEESRLSPKEKIELFACIREAFTNIRKHSGARQVDCRLSSCPGGWKLVIEDDGKGFCGDPFASPTSFGLKIMQERARQIGAVLSFTREQEKTKLIIQKEGGEIGIPLPYPDRR